MQPEDEEDMAIANAFVLKAQKYKAAQLASPTNMRGNTSKTSTVTTTKIGRRTVQGATTTTKPVWKDGRKEIVTTQIKGTGKVKPATYADSKKTASKKSSDKEGEYTFNSGKRVKFETTRESKIMRTGGLTGTKEVNYQYTGEIEDSSQGISQSKLQGIDEGRSQATIEGRTQYEAINDAKMKLSSLQEARSLKAEERAESKDTTYKFPEPSLENRDEARYEFSGGNNSQSRLGITGGRSIESRYQMTRKSMGSPRFGDTDEERKETRYEQASEEDTEAMYGSKGEETIHTRYELTGQNNSQSKYEMSGGRYSRANYGITSQDSAEARYGSSTHNYKARYGLPQEEDSEMKYERTEGTRISTTKKIEKSRIISGGNSDTKEVTYKTYQAFSVGNSAREESRYQADEGPGGYTTQTIESRVTSSEKSPGAREYIYKYTGDKDLVEGTSSRYEYIDGKRVLVSETIEKRMGNLESSGNKGTAFEYSGARYKTIGGKRLLTTEKSDESEIKSGGISQWQENTHAYSGGLGGDQKSRYSIYSSKRSLGGDSIGSNLMKSGEVSSSKDYSYKHSREQEEGEYEIINGKRVKVSESQEMRYSRSGDEGRVSYEFTKSKPATSKSSISIGQSIRSRQEYEKSGGNEVEYEIGNDLVRYELEESASGELIMWQISQNGSRKRVDYNIVEEQIDKDEGVISHDILEDRQVQYMDIGGKSTRYEIFAGHPSNVLHQEAKTTRTVKKKVTKSTYREGDTTYYYKPETSSATVRVKKASFQKQSSEILNSHRKGYTMTGRAKEKQIEDAPGPGMYSYKSMISEGPQYSIFKKREKEKKVEYIPGPGDYEQTSQIKSGWTMGKRHKTVKKEEEVPGPGYYDTKVEKNVQSFRIAAKREKKVEETPGPGYYDATKEGTVRGIALSKSKKVEKFEEAPGPGQYETKSKIVEGPHYSMLKKRETKVEATPGPGDYEMKIETKEGVTIGKRMAEKVVEQAPGPGNYEVKTNFTEGPKYSIYKKHQEKIEQTPGPGDYEDVKEKKEGFTIGTKIAEKIPENIPGPGNYEEKSYLIEGPSYSIYQKREEKVEQTPGPGDYEEIKKEQKGVTIGQKLKEKAPENIPGPGEYTEKSHIIEGPQYSIYQKREVKIEQTPGPGHYEEVKEEKGGVTIGQRLKEKDAEDLPGPGNYEEKSYITEGTKYSIYQKREEKIEQTPGPGDYEDVKEKKEGFTIGTKIAEKIPENIPGPGNYEEKSYLIEGPSYSIYQKREEKVEQTPGPGDYEEKVEKREGFTIGQRLIEKEREDIPGPGNYEGKSFITEGAKYSISQRRDEKVDQTPGPGDYEEIVEKKGGITIGERLKEKQVEDIPGPGNYEEKSTIAEGPSYSIYQRREEKIEQTPGPGDYEEVKKEQRGITIGEKVREKEGEDIPGPGNYEEKSFITEGAKYSIYQRREEKVEQTPGPGDYEEVVEKKGGITMGQRYEDKTGDDHEDEPGPGHYRYYDPQLEGKGVTFTKEKRDKNVDNQVPGPGNYTGISDWAPGYGYEMSISASQFGSQDGYQIIREYEGEDSEGRVIESRRVLRVIHEDEHGNPIEFIDNEAQLIGNAIEGTGRVVRTEGGLAQHMFTDSNTQLIQRSQLEGESNNEGGYYIIRRQIRDTETEEQIPEGEGGYIIKRQIIAVGPEQEIEDESSQLIKREIRTFESGEETPKEESYVIKRETKNIHSATFPEEVNSETLQKSEVQFSEAVAQEVTNKIVEVHDEVEYEGKSGMKKGVEEGKESLAAEWVTDLRLSSGGEIKRAMEETIRSEILKETVATQEHLKQPTQNPRIPKKTNPITEGTKMTEQRHATQEQKKERRGKSARVLGIPSYSEKRALKKAGKKVERSEGVKKEVVEYSEGRYDIQRGDPREIEGRESYKVTYEGNYTPEEIEALEKQMVFKAEGGMRSSMKQKTIVTSTNKTGTVVKTKKIGGKVTKTITSGGKVISEETKNESIPEFESSDQVRTSNLSGLGTMTEKKKVSTSKGGVTTTTVTKKFTSGPTITKTTTGSTIRTVTKGPVTTVTTTSSGTKKTSKTKTISDKK